MPASVSSILSPIFPQEHFFMKKLIPLFASACVLCTSSRADLFNYDFGSGTGTHTTGASTSFLPAPAVGGGTARVRVGSTAGSFSMVNAGDALGAATELQGIAPTSASLNKFAIYDIASPTTQFSLAFTLKLTGGTSGTWSMFLGDGATYTNDAGFSGTQVMSGIQWIFGSSGAITENYRNGGSWTALPNTFSQDSEYHVEIYANNSAAAAAYGTSQSLASNKWDLWINNVLVGDDLNKGQLGAAANIDSFMFYGESSAGNVAKIILDDIQYANTLTLVPEPASAGLLALGLLLLRRRR